MHLALDLEIACCWCAVDGTHFVDSIITRSYSGGNGIHRIRSAPWPHPHRDLAGLADTKASPHLADGWTALIWLANGANAHSRQRVVLS